MEDKREQIINGLKLLKEECGKESPSNCPDKCPYEDICEMITEISNSVVIPHMLDFGNLKDSAK